MRFQTIAMLLMFVVLTILVLDKNNYYTADAKITEVHGENITLMDTTGMLWDFTGSDFIVGDKVKVKFFLNRTEDLREDDEVVEVNKYE